jgi:hypothetical protein
MMQLKKFRVAELANASVIHPKDPGANHGVDSKCFCSVCAGFEFKSLE